MCIPAANGAKTNNDVKGEGRGTQSPSCMIKCTKTSLTSTLIPFVLRWSSYTMVYLGTILLGGSRESREGANPFQQTLYSLAPGVAGCGLSVRICSAV